MKIIIVGGGITGLTTALALKKLGLSCEVFEQAPVLNEVGAGIWMQPNAMKVLDWIGVGDQVREAGFQIGNVDFIHPNLVPVRRVKEAHVGNTHAQKITSIHRARLQKVLFEALPKGTVHLGQAYTKHETAAGSIKVHFSDGEVKGDILLGADGIHSKVRQQLFPDSSIRYSGQTCWRGIAPMSLLDAAHPGGVEAWGRSGRFGFAPISAEEVYWYAVAKAPQGQKDAPGSTKEKLNQLFQDFHPLVLDIIQQTSADKIMRHDISDLKRLPAWYQDRVCLMGDAAHATTPNMGQGGGQGVEDAYYLSNILAKEEQFTSAFQLFEKQRRKKVDYIVNTSWQFGKMAHSPIGQPLFKWMLKWSPDSLMKKQMEKMYAIKKF